MDKTTPPKHKTPNYKLNEHRVHPAGEKHRRKTSVWIWEPVPLRANRKDLSVIHPS